MSARVTSTSWPIPASTGIFEEKMAVATSSSLKHQRSSSEPPPRMITATCAQPWRLISSRARQICPAAPSPCTLTGNRRTSAPRPRTEASSMKSWMAAPAGDVTSATRLGLAGSGRLRSAAKKPRAASACLRSSKAWASRPCPPACTSSTISWYRPRGP